MSRRLWDPCFELLHRFWPVITVVLAYVSIPYLMWAYWREGPRDAGVRYVEGAQ